MSTNSRIIEQLNTLVSIGDRVTVEYGRLRIITKDGRAVPNDWLQENESSAIVALCGLQTLPVYRYCGYSTGCYGAAKAGGITLQLAEAATGASAYLIFNVDVRYSRNTKHTRCGARMESNRFRAPEHCLFIKFWQSCGIAMPPRNGLFYDRMGKLKPIYYTGSKSKNERLDAKSFAPVELTENQVREALDIPPIDRTTSVQLPYNNRTTSVQKDRTSSQLEPISGNALSAVQTTGNFDHGKKVTRHHGDKGGSNTPVSNPFEQTTNEWLKDYDEAS